ncbi:hypothetical protein RJT34_23297 [Clitoria ternatea]|uniref:Uncharacterized protein n=1 Tax=Clitoria ternatea TaxID=43366 RepID=A0AAN9FNL1_CLITE
MDDEGYGFGGDREYSEDDGLRRRRCTQMREKAYNVEVVVTEEEMKMAYGRGMSYGKDEVKEKGEKREKKVNGGA